jgi:hypothetical protein
MPQPLSIADINPKRPLKPSTQTSTHPNTPQRRPKPPADHLPSSRIPAKRRYIAPALAADGAANQNIEEMAAANLRAAGSGGGDGGASTSGGGGGAGAGAGGAALTAHALSGLDGVRGSDGGSDSGSEAELRPRLRSLGDSVTSAARFEQEEVGEPEGGGGGGGLALGERSESLTDELSAAAAAAALAAAANRRGAAPPGGGGGGLGFSLVAQAVARRASANSSNGSSAPWPGGVEAPSAVAGSGESIVMGSANPPRVGALASPFGNYNFGAIGSGGSGSGSGSGADAGGGGAAGGMGSGGGVVCVGPDGRWVADGLQASLAIASGSGSAGGSAGGSGVVGGPRG